MEYFIRKALFEELNTLANLFHKTVENINIQDYNKIQIEVWKKKANYSRWVELWNSDLTFIVAETPLKEIVGFTSFRSTGYIHSMFVHHLYQRNGIATHLLKQIETQCYNTALKSEASITAKPFFEKMGFNVIKEQNVSIENIKLKNYIMIKRITK